MSYFILPRGSSTKGVSAYRRERRIVKGYRFSVSLPGSLMIFASGAFEIANVDIEYDQVNCKWLINA